MINNIDPNGKMIFKQGGIFYNVVGNDALILNKYLDYKLYGVNQFRTGFGVASKDTALIKIDTLGMNYDLIDGKGNVIISKRFENNQYEIIDPNYPLEGVKSTYEEPRKISKKLNFSSKERLTSYIEILQGLSEGVDVLSGEIIDNISDELKALIFEMAIYFDNKLKVKAKLDQKYPNHGKKWDETEDEQLVIEFSQKISIKEMCELHQRGQGAIYSRLLKLNLVKTDRNIDEPKSTTTDLETVVIPDDNVTNSNKKESFTCFDCKFYNDGNGECPGKEEICLDFEKAYKISKREQEYWPEYGDATFIRLKKGKFDY